MNPLIDALMAARHALIRVAKIAGEYGLRAIEEGRDSDAADKQKLSASSMANVVTINKVLKAAGIDPEE